MAGRLLVVLVALFLAAFVVCNSAVAVLGERAPGTAARIWPGEPHAEIAAAMSEIGRAAAQHRAVPPGVFARVEDAARKLPPVAEPFLVRGVRAQLAGDAAAAMAAFTAAERRDPRSLPAHYFLADALFRTGDAPRGLEEAAVLARLAPNGVGSVAPYIAAYAQDRSTWPRLRALFRSSPDLEEVTLAALAKDAANVDAVIALADEAHRDAKQSWVPVLLTSLVDAGEYQKARAAWGAAAHVQPAPDAIYDSGFAEPNAPPPFNWALTASTVGLAERQPGGRLHVVFYGRDDGLLARQLLLLRPGLYRLTMSEAGNASHARALTWSLRCDRTQTPFAAIPVDVAAARPWSFTVPAGCPAQWLELTGVSPEMPQQTEVTIANLKLVPERSGE